MNDDADRQRILDRADRLLKQSKTLRKMSDELLEESHDIRKSVKEGSSRKSRARKRR